MTRRRVVVTGLGAISPVGNTVAEAWDAIINGRSGIGEITRFDTSSFPVKIAGEVRNFDVGVYLSPKEARRMDKFIHYGLAAGVQAFRDSGLEVNEANAHRIGVNIGSGIGGLPMIEDTHDDFLAGGARKISPFFIPGTIINMISGFLSIHLGLQGPNYAIATACTTDYFRAFVTRDVIGLEMCGSLKNVVALAVGMARGAGYGENTAAMIETRGLAELTALGEAAGADPKTFAGLAGVGDLIATCGSPLSRNYTFGSNLGKGLSVEEATKVSNGVAEGVPTTDAVVALGKQYGVPTPLATAMSHVLDDGISCAQMLSELFGEGITEE